jgi:mono/diheme cytochrome c family protein
MRPVWFAVGAITLAGLAAVGWTVLDRGLPVGNGVELARGAAIYAEACAAYHGANLEGEPNWRSPRPDGRLPAPPHDASGHTWHHPDRVLLDITKRGTAAVVGRGYESNMPGFGDQYSDEELRSVLAWIRSQWPERERQFQAEITSRDEEQRN